MQFTDKQKEDYNKKLYLEDPTEQKPIAWKCSSDGKHFATFSKKKCRYCVPVYDAKDLPTNH